MKENSMEMGKRCSVDYQKSRVKKKINLNEFTPVVGKRGGDEVIKEFLFQKDVAAWFRGTSHYHIKGANRLLNALRDDGEQKTTHRVQACLNLIGLKPMVTPKQIKFSMDLSRGNDLVFLWFLMEEYYKTPKAKHLSFSQNEQLICSAICHLDMITTLRELDKILPSGQHTSEIKIKRQVDLKESFKKIKHQVVKQQFTLPYFIKHHRPQHYGKRLSLEQPNFIVNFKNYSRFNDPNYTVQNETNRWFADYHFSPGKRIAHSIIREILKNIFYNFETVSSKTKSTEILCDYHKTLKKTETDLKHELKVKARNECFKRMGATYKEKEDNEKVIKEFLNDAVEQQWRIFSKQAKTVLKDDKLKTITSDCKVCDVILGGNECSTGYCKSNTNTNCEAITKVLPNNLKQTRTPPQEMSSNENLEPHKDSSHENKSRSVKETVFTPSDTFFKSPSKHQPYSFNYKKIFANFELNQETDHQKIILKALGEKISNLSTKNKNWQLLYHDAVRNCTKRTFDNAVNKFETVKAQCAKGSNPLSQYPPLTNYSAENFQLMDKMLYEAFQHLRQNPKFVWAQLPDAHKVPFLREWIAHRFGKEYTPKERAKSYRRSCIIFRALERNNLPFPAPPNANKIGKNLFIDYNCRKQVERKVQQIKSNYYHSLDSHFLEHTRVFWFAMRGYICSNGPPRKSFYAYMPSRLQDIQHFRLWKSSEYRNNWNAWNIRRHKR